MMACRSTSNFLEFLSTIFTPLTSSSTSVSDVSIIMGRYSSRSLTVCRNFTPASGSSAPSFGNRQSLTMPSRWS